MRLTLGKDKRLKKQKHFDELFAKGRSEFSYPLKIQYLNVNDTTTKVAFVVPKRRIRKAHERNVLKRKLREAYRLQQHELNEIIGCCHLCIIFVGKSSVTVSDLQLAMLKLFNKIKNQ